MRHLLLEEFHLAALIPESTPPATARVMKQTLNSRHFRAAILSAIQAVIRQHPTLRRLKVDLST